MQDSDLNDTALFDVNGFTIYVAPKTNLNGVPNIRQMRYLFKFISKTPKSGGNVEYKDCAKHFLGNTKGSLQNKKNWQNYGNFPNLK